MAKSYTYNQFREDSDPIEDMGIGMDVAIKHWIETETNYAYLKKDLLSICALENKIDFVKYLLAKEPDNNILRWASINGYTDIVKALLDAGADVHANDDEALCWASFWGHTETVKVLLDAGANVHAQDNLALQWAKEQGHTEVVKVLQDHIDKEKK